MRMERLDRDRGRQWVRSASLSLPGAVLVTTAVVINVLMYEVVAVIVEPGER